MRYALCVVRLCAVRCGCDCDCVLCAACCVLRELIYAPTSPFCSNQYLHGSPLHITNIVDLFLLPSSFFLPRYSMARHFWSLSVTDMCEIAANSVRQSGFPEELKKVWHGERCGEYVDEK